VASSKLFGGTNLGEIANAVKDRKAPSPFDIGTTAKPSLAAAELALSGRILPTTERDNIYLVDPRRCRPWAFHNRSLAWYTKERCQDLIDSIPRDGQLEPVLARKLSGEAEFDYELIYGMRRRYACEFLNAKLRLRVESIDDTRAAILMHAENADRQDITPMERALSFHAQIEARLFATQDALAEAFGVSKGQVAKMVKAAQLMKHPTLSQLFPERSGVPVEQAYKLAALMERPAAKEVILQAAQNLLKRSESGREARDVIKLLADSLDRSRKFEAMRRQYHLAPNKRLIVNRNLRGKVTLAFPQSLQGVTAEELNAVMSQVLRDFG
jgi:ParB family chromosome partitioning protein